MVRELLITSYTMTPLAHTPSSSSPNTGFFSRPARWNSTPYSGSCWTLCGQIIMPSSHPQELLGPHGVCIISGLQPVQFWINARWREDEQHFVTCNIFHPSHSLFSLSFKINVTPKSIWMHLKLSKIHKFKYQKNWLCHFCCDFLVTMRTFPKL